MHSSKVRAANSACSSSIISGGANANRVFSRAQQQDAFLERAVHDASRENRARAPSSSGRGRFRRRSSILCREHRRRFCAAQANPPCGSSEIHRCAGRSQCIAFRASPSSTSAAATQTGLPPKVEACAPGFQSIRLARAIVAESGMPEAIPFATQRMSGSIPA